MCDTKPISKFSLDEMQVLNETIYGPNNELYFGHLRIIARIGRFVGRLPKAVEYGDPNVAAFHATMAFSWSLALANKLGIRIQDELWKRYPGVCSHCESGPCMCKQIKAFVVAGQIQPSKIVTECPLTLDAFQIMFQRIYPRNTPMDECGHLLQELCEVLEAMDNFTGTKRPEFKNDSVVELCDVFAHICGVANCSKIGLAPYMERYFSRGCYECHSTPCRCPFPATRTVSPHRKH
jgi:NTP pyrophosphatase (non-canonical NTP hydrolase)